MDFDPDRDRGVLSSDDREMLLGEKEYKHRQSAVNARSRIRGRIRESIRDFKLIFEHLSERDRKRIFDDDLREGAVCMVAFLFELLMDEGDRAFERLLRDAMKRVAERKGWYLVNFEFKITFRSGEELDQIQELFENDEATKEQAVTLHQNDRITLEELTEYLKSDPGK